MPRTSIWSCYGISPRTSIPRRRTPSGRTASQCAAPRRRPVSGAAVVRMLVDTLGHVEERNIEILEIPASAFSTALKQTLTSVLSSPARIAGKPVRSLASYRLNLTPPPPRDPVHLIDL